MLFKTISLHITCGKLLQFSVTGNVLHAFGVAVYPITLCTLGCNSFLWVNDPTQAPAGALGKFNN